MQNISAKLTLYEQLVKIQIRMKKFHLIGQNIKTSLSPLIHNTLFQMKGLSKSHIYSLYPKQSYLLKLQQMTSDKQIHGLSITIPFKQSYASEIKNRKLNQDTFKIISNTLISAESILSKRNIINTININRTVNNSQFHCCNTDIFGVKQCFKKNKAFSSIIKFNLPFINNNNQEASSDIQNNSKNTLAIVIGGGATAEVFMAFFEELGIKMIVLNRSIQKIIQLKQNYYKQIYHVSSFLQKEQVRQLASKQKYCLIKNLVIINTLPTEILQQTMALNSHQGPNYLNEFHNYAVNLQRIYYMDVNYRDKQEILLRVINQVFKTRKKQIAKQKISTGLDMLLWQGILQNHIFSKQNNQNTESIQNSFNFQYQELIKVLKRNYIV